MSTLVIFVIVAASLLTGTMSIGIPSTFAAGSGGHSCDPVFTEICHSGGGGSGKGGGGSGGSGTTAICNSPDDCVTAHSGSGGGSGQGGGGSGGSTAAISCPDTNDLSTCTTTHTGSGGRN